MADGGWLTTVGLIETQNEPDVKSSQGEGAFQLLGEFVLVGRLCKPPLSAAGWKPALRGVRS